MVRAPSTKAPRPRRTPTLLGSEIDTGLAGVKADITRLETRLPARMHGGLAAMAAVLPALTRLLP